MTAKSRRITPVLAIGLPLCFIMSMTFKDLGVIPSILKALDAEGYENPTPIQEKGIPILLSGKDLLGCAQTGTGKTAAFSIPIIQLLEEEFQLNKRSRKIRSLIVTPTRELAIQIGDSISKYAKFTSIRNTVIFGGVKQGAQVKELKKGVDILVATPGRLLDLIGQGFVHLKEVEYLVLDEADHMLDMGFIHDIKKIIKYLPEKRQSLFFSATMPPEIVKLSGKILGKPEKITINPDQATAERVDQAVYFVHKKNKIKLLTHLCLGEDVESLLVFSRTKHGANKIVKLLKRADIQAEAIHGNKSQASRQKALANFKAGKTVVLVATDIAARGIDVSGLSHVVNYDLPNVPETYVHRIGRTGRANASGIAISFCMEEEKPYLKSIQRLIKQQVPVVSDHPYPDDGTFPEMEILKGKPGQDRGSGNSKPRQRRDDRDRKPKNPRSKGRGGSGRKSGSGEKTHSGEKTGFKKDGGEGNQRAEAGGAGKKKKRREPWWKKKNGKNIADKSKADGGQKDSKDGKSKDARGNGKGKGKPSDNSKRNDRNSKNSNSKGGKNRNSKNPKLIVSKEPEKKINIKEVDRTKIEGLKAKHRKSGEDVSELW